MPELTNCEAPDLTVYTQAEHGLVTETETVSWPAPELESRGGLVSSPAAISNPSHQPTRLPPASPEADEVIHIFQVPYPHESAEREHQANFKHCCVSDSPASGVLVDGTAIRDKATKRRLVLGHGPDGEYTVRLNPSGS